MIEDIREKCIAELTNVHGRHVSLRFERILENREHAEGKTLTGEKVKNLKILFDTEIYLELLGKRGK